MDAINSPLGINPLQAGIVDQLGTKVKVGIVIGGGDGRLAREIEEKIQGATVYNVEDRAVLHAYRKSDVSAIWDVAQYEALAKKHGGFDFIILQNIHEYWGGQLASLKEILQLLKPDGRCWLSFYNGSNLHEIGRRIPPYVTGYEQLGSPMDHWPRMDLTSWMIYFSDLGMSVKTVWGVLQEEAYEYCKKSPKVKPMEWKTKDFGVMVEDIGDAFILGASVMCLQVSPEPEAGENIQTQFMGVSGNASMIQAILLPHDSDCGKEMDLFRAQVQLEAQQYEGEDESHPFMDMFVEQLADFGDVKRVLVVGCDWGADMLALKGIKKEWDVVGIEGNRDIVDLASELMKDSGIAVEWFDEQKAFDYKDGEFDLVISLRYFSRIYYPLAVKLAQQMVRVAKKGVAHFEDYRGPEVSLKLKSYDIPSIYKDMGMEYEARPLNIEDKPSGMYFIKVKK